MVIGADICAVKHGASEGVQIAAQELDAAVIGDAAVLVGAIEEARRKKKQRHPGPWREIHGD